MDSGPEEGRSEEQDYTPILYDDALLLIFSELNWRDINNLKLVSRKFYGVIHGNYHKLKRRDILKISIRHDRSRIRYPFCVKMAFRDQLDEDLPNMRFYFYTKTINFESVEELPVLLKLFCMRVLYKLSVRVDDAPDIFGILGDVLQVGTKVKYLQISKLAEGNFGSFRTFIGKFSSVEVFFIRHICAPSTKKKDGCSLLSSLTSFNTIRWFEIYECNKTKILSNDFFTELLVNNPDSVFKEHFTVYRPCKIESGCGYNEIELTLCFGGNFKRLHRILRNGLSGLENVKDVTSSRNSQYELQFESNVDCKYCLKRRHQIKRSVEIELFIPTCERFYR